MVVVVGTGGGGGGGGEAGGGGGEGEAGLVIAAPTPFPTQLLRFHLTLVGWLVGFGFNGPLRQYFSLYRAVSKEREREGKG